MFARFPTLSVVCFGLLATNALASPLDTTPLDAAAKPSELQGLSIGDVANALQVDWLQRLDVYLNCKALQQNLVDVDTSVKNPLIIEFTLEKFVAKGALDGTTYLLYNQTFTPPVVIPRFAETSLPKVIDGYLDQSHMGDLVSASALDVTADVVVRAGTTNGKGGIEIPINGLKQVDVSTIYHFDFTACT